MFHEMARWAQKAPFSQLDMDMMVQKAEQAAHAEGPRIHYLIGLSVGQGSQPSGIAVLEKVKARSSGSLAQYTCRYLERVLPPETAYPALLAKLQEMLQHPQLARCDLVVEAGASLSAVVSYFQRARLPAQIRPVEVKVSGPTERSDRTRKVSKGTLIETTRQVLQEVRLVFDRMPAHLTATTPRPGAVHQALASYPFNKTVAANEAFASRDGDYDDLVLAVTLACWFGERCQKTPAILW